MSLLLHPADSPGTVAMIRLIPGAGKRGCFSPACAPKTAPTDESITTKGSTPASLAMSATSSGPSTAHMIPMAVAPAGRELFICFDQSATHAHKNTGVCVLSGEYAPGVTCLSTYFVRTRKNTLAKIHRSLVKRLEPEFVGCVGRGCGEMVCMRVPCRWGLLGWRRCK